MVSVFYLSILGIKQYQYYICSAFFFFQVNLKLILVSGKTKEFLFSPSESAGDIAQHVFDHWPEGICC